MCVCVCEKEREIFKEGLMKKAIALKGAKEKKGFRKKEMHRQIDWRLRRRRRDRDKEKVRMMLDND